MLRSPRLLHSSLINNLVTCLIFEILDFYQCSKSPNFTKLHNYQIIGAISFIYLQMPYDNSHYSQYCLLSKFTTNLCTFIYEHECINVAYHSGI